MLHSLRNVTNAQETSLLEPSQAQVKSEKEAVTRTPIINHALKSE